MCVAAPGRNLALFIAALSVLLAVSVGCTPILGDFDTRAVDTSVPQDLDGGVQGDRASGDSGHTESCSSGAKQCKGQDLMVCNASGVAQSEATCPYLCTSGACTGICKPGDIVLIGSGNRVSTIALMLASWAKGAAVMPVDAGTPRVS